MSRERGTIVLVSGTPAGATMPYQLCMSMPEPGSSSFIPGTSRSRGSTRAQYAARATLSAALEAYRAAFASLRIFSLLGPVSLI